MKVIRRSFFLLCALALATCSQALAHPGGITTPSANLPPDGVYLSPFDVHATYGGAALQIVLQAVQHKPFELLNPNDFECGSAGVPAGQCEHHEFDSGLSADYEVLMNGIPQASGHILMDGPVKTNAYGRTSPTQPGFFPTEMVSMNLTSLGPGPFGPPVMVCAGIENGVTPTLGQTNIIPIGGGMYHIDSFFDVFTEISLDGGANWIPSNGSTHVNLFPEPGSLVLLALGFMGFAGLARRR